MLKRLIFISFHDRIKTRIDCNNLKLHILWKKISKFTMFELIYLIFKNKDLEF